MRSITENDGGASHTSARLLRREGSPLETCERIDSGRGRGHLERALSFLGCFVAGEEEGEGEGEGSEDGSEESAEGEGDGERDMEREAMREARRRRRKSETQKAIQTPYY
jgi:hypothetical protein